MITRCENRNRPSWKNYGARGITVCARWRLSFEAFFADVGPRPSSRHTVERGNNDGNYEPGNVRWALRVEQNNNSRWNRHVEIDGQRITTAQAARNAGVKYTTLISRLNRGMSVHEALRL